MKLEIDLNNDKILEILTISITPRYEGIEEKEIFTQIEQTTIELLIFFFRNFRDNWKTMNDRLFTLHCRFLYTFLPDDMDQLYFEKQDLQERRDSLKYKSILDMK